ncbi:MAG: L-histidine N(alpha)-methyltransferase [Planctomycetes bacterium]|nr:L-histidine N(alpha)-methyltransferase [Planctomycetota bacterium]
MRKVMLIDADGLERRLAGHLRRRELPDLFLYTGADGARQWLELDRCEAFDIASGLTDLLGRSAPRIAARAARGADLLSLGVGEGAKERILLEWLAPRGTRRYVAADVSEPLVDRALALVEDMDLERVGVVAGWEDLPRFRGHARPPALLCLLGNTLCNYDGDALLGMLASCMAEGDRLLVDCHLLPDGGARRRRWRRHVEAAYGGEANARFNLAPLLSRGMRPGQAEFAIDLQDADTPAGTALRTRKRIRFLDDVALTVAGGPVEFRAGETLAMGFTWKYRRRQLHDLLVRSGLAVETEFRGGCDEYTLLLAHRAPGA